MEKAFVIREGSVASPSFSHFPKVDDQKVVSGEYGQKYEFIFEFFGYVDDGGRGAVIGSQKNRYVYSDEEWDKNKAQREMRALLLMGEVRIFTTELTALCKKESWKPAWVWVSVICRSYNEKRQLYGVDGGNYEVANFSFDCEKSERTGKSMSNLDGRRFLIEIRDGKVRVNGAAARFGQRSMVHRQREMAAMIPKHSHNKSYYGKADVRDMPDGSKVLKSYSTDVAKVTADGKFVRLWSGYSATSMRHISDFAMQYTNDFPNGVGKKQWDAMPVGERRQAREGRALRTRPLKRLKPVQERIVKPVSEYTFIDAMTPHGFSRAGAGTLFDWYEDLSDDSGEDIEFDPVAFRCEWTEYDHDGLITDFEYLVAGEDYDDDTEYFDALLGELNDNTTVLEVNDDCWLVQEF